MIAEIPIPPSANHLWSIFGNRMHKRKAYKDWIEVAGYLVRQQMRPVATGEYPVSVYIRITGGKGWSKARDLDNVAKPVLDLLREALVLSNDTCAYVSAVGITYDEPASRKAEATCTVEVML